LFIFVLDIIILFSYSDCTNGLGWGCTGQQQEGANSGKKGAIKYAKQVQLEEEGGKEGGGIEAGYPRHKLHTWTKAKVC
jgi:hypothetical protein